MKNNFFIDNNIRINPSVSRPAPSKPDAAVKNNTSFSELLDKQIRREEVTFSRHAMDRLQSRNISLSAEGMEKLNEAVLKADAKGSKESLILMDDMAFVVSVKNKTVITAVDGASIKENVFTNIDSAVIV